MTKASVTFDGVLIRHDFMQRPKQHQGLPQSQPSQHLQPWQPWQASQLSSCLSRDEAPKYVAGGG